MKYFFLSDSWTTGRVWEFGGLWNELAWHREPYLQQQSLCIKENDETLHLYAAEDAILMVEVMPKALNQPTIGQVRLKRLLSAEQAIERLCQEEQIFQRCQGIPTTAPQSSSPGNRPTDNRPRMTPTVDVSKAGEENGVNRHNLTSEEQDSSRRPVMPAGQPQVTQVACQEETGTPHTMTTNSEPTAIN